MDGRAAGLPPTVTLAFRRWASCWLATAAAVPVGNAAVGEWDPLAPAVDAEGEPSIWLRRRSEVAMSWRSTAFSSAAADI